MQIEENKILKALDTVLSERYPTRLYNLKGYQEESNCLEKVKDGWIIYNGERGNHYNEKKYDTILLACVKFLRFFTHNPEQITEMENEFIKQIVIEHLK